MINNETKERRVKVEEFMFGRRGVGALLRLKGCWLEKAGFKPGEVARVISTGPGVIELRMGGEL